MVYHPDDSFDADYEHPMRGQVPMPAYSKQRQEAERQQAVLMEAKHDEALQARSSRDAVRSPKAETTVEMDPSMSAYGPVSEKTSPK